MKMKLKRFTWTKRFRSRFLKRFVRLKKTIPQRDTLIEENKPSTFQGEEGWNTLHFFAIQSIVQQASISSPKEFHKILFTASLLNKHWKSAIDSIVERLDLKMHWQLNLDTLLTRFSHARRLRLISTDGDSLMHLRQHTHVEDLELYAADFSSLRITKGLSQLKFLQGLSLKNSPSLNDRALRAVSDCSNLRQLDLTGCSLISGEGIRIISGISSLVDLYLGDCTGISSDGLCSLSSLRRLETLDLSKIASVTDPVLHALSSLPNLTDLNLFMCPDITDVGLWYLADKVFLRKLNLFSCEKITDEGLRAISHQSSLRKLNLGWCCLLTDYGIQFLSNLELLCELRLSCVGITHQALAFLSKLVYLRLLDVRGCDVHPLRLTQGITLLKKSLPRGQLVVLRS